MMGWTFSEGVVVWLVGKESVFQLKMVQMEDLKAAFHDLNSRLGNVMKG